VTFYLAVFATCLIMTLVCLKPEKKIIDFNIDYEIRLYEMMKPDLKPDEYDYLMELIIHERKYETKTNTE